MPVEPAVLGAFVVAVTALVMSPGPDTVLVLRYTLISGRRVGLATVAGVQLGLLAHTLAAVLGISLIIASSPALFKTVAVAGAGYLGWLGIQGLRGGGALGLGAGSAPAAMTTACRDAIICNILNPKVILLFLALFPNFVDARRGGVISQLLTLAAVLIAINVVWQAPLAWVADAVRRWLVTPAVGRALSRGTGAVLLAFAALMLCDHFG